MPGYADEVATRCPLCGSEITQGAHVEFSELETEDVIDCPRCGKIVINSATAAVLGLAEPEVIEALAAELRARRIAGDLDPVFLRPEQLV